MYCGCGKWLNGGVVQCEEIGKANIELSACNCGFRLAPIFAYYFTEIIMGEETSSGRFKHESRMGNNLNMVLVLEECLS